MRNFTIVFFCCAALLTAGCSRQSQPERLYPVPAFSLLDQSGASVTLDDLKGRVWVADFIFTNCAGACPMMTDQMRKLEKLVPDEIRMVSFSVDPDRDTPKALAAYAAEHGASRDRWLFLTGEKHALYDLCVKGFKLPVDDSGGTTAEPIMHSTRFALVDKDGQVRGYYEGTDADDLKRLSADAKTLL
jgi:protein SCO1/2